MNEKELEKKLVSIKKELAKERTKKLVRFAIDNYLNSDEFEQLVGKKVEEKLEKKGLLRFFREAVRREVYKFKKKWEKKDE